MGRRTVAELEAQLVIVRDAIDNPVIVGQEIENDSGGSSRATKFVSLETLQMRELSLIRQIDNLNGNVINNESSW